MRSGKNAKNMLKIAFFGLKSDLYRFSGMLNPNLSSSFKPEVEIRAFLRMRSIETATLVNNNFFGVYIPNIQVFGYDGCSFRTA